jgi:deoxyhypusine monooxygenase
MEKPEISEFDSVDPAPASETLSVPSLRSTICDEGERMFQRMRALFALRNIGGVDAIEALAAAYSSKSALLKHEIAYVMGQMQDPAAVPHLINRLEDHDEDLMVRHEAAEALGAIGDRTALATLEKFVDDPEPVVAESCEVAMDLLEYVASKSLDYEVTD